MVLFHIALEFSDYDEPFVRISSESGQRGRAVEDAIAIPKTQSARSRPLSFELEVTLKVKLHGH